MPLVVSPEITIPDSDLSMAFVRASGPGGQNVNKVASAVQLRFDLDGSSALNERVKTRLRRLAGRRLTDEGSILIIARSHREQERNRQDALDRLGELIREALIEPKIRRPTKPTRSSKERRITGKVKQGRNKQLRSKVRWDD